MKALETGARLGPYEIIAPIGAGGMGEVYKATDTRLTRTVAIKVLPPHWVADAEMKQRFDREAQTIASLNHPNICVLHDIGRLRASGPAGESGPEIDFLVMEFLAGETLSDRIKRGPLPLDEALDIAIAITDALDKAHRQRVIHRDLKPSNVMLTATGPKLLDFGLAKTNAYGAAEEPAKKDDAMAAAQRSGLTVPGMLIGTLQYMAPEQLEGGDADARTDIFALGVLMHEMISGKKTFEGKSRVLLMSAIATVEPPMLSTVQPAAPPALDHVVRTCLAKDPADRWQTARDLLAELRAIASGVDEGFVTRAAPASRRRSLLTTAAAVLAMVVGVAVSVPAYFQLRQQPAAEPLRFRIPIQLGTDSNALSVANVSAGIHFRADGFAVSPNGKQVSFIARPVSVEPWMLYVRPLRSLAPIRIPATEDAGQSFWSSDSREIAFVAAGKLKKVDATGGSPQDICPVTEFYGGSWNADGTIIFGTTQGLFSVSAQGGTPKPLTTVEAGESGHFFPHFLPDGRQFLYTAGGQSNARGTSA